LCVSRGSGGPGGDRDQFPPPHRDAYRAPPPAGVFPDRYPPQREEYASDQVKDLLELYFRDPQAFDQYAKTYFYGERMERLRTGYVRVCSVLDNFPLCRLFWQPQFESSNILIPLPDQSWNFSYIPDFSDAELVTDHLCC